MAMLLTKLILTVKTKIKVLFSISIKHGKTIDLIISMFLILNFFAVKIEHGTKHLL